MQVPPPPLRDYPSRDDVIKQLESQTFDILIIGGGATGLGAALEATRRGYSVALVEKHDFASGTSSRSTNMLHGGVRYLQNAINNNKKSEMDLVRKGLKQEARIFRSAPFLVQAVPICVPVYNKKDKKKYEKVLKKYDALATSTNPFPELRWATRKQLLFDFPNLKEIDANGKPLLGGWIYYDGQQDDARMALLLALTARENNAVLLNYAEVVEIQKDDTGMCTGVLVNDVIHELDQEVIESNNEDKRLSTGSAVKKVVQVLAKTVINATGPFSDAIRKLDQPRVENIIRPAAGTHVVLPAHFSPQGMGLVIMETTDGRVLFSLPWKGCTLVGTTDKLVEVTDLPEPTLEEITWIITELNRYLDDSLDATLEDVLSTWAGIRPLAVGTQSLTGTNPSSAQSRTATKGLTREHLIEVSPSQLISIAGGKWTTSYVMATDVINHAVEIGKLPEPNPELSISYPSTLIGADSTGRACRQKFELVVIQLKKHYSLSNDTAEMLQECYGTRALHVAEIATADDGTGANLLHPQYPFIEAQVTFGVRYEMAHRATDILSRRTRLAQMDVVASKAVAPRVIELMGKELGWSAARCEKEMTYVDAFLGTMGYELVMKARG